LAGLLVCCLWAPAEDKKDKKDKKEAKKNPAAIPKDRLKERAWKQRHALLAARGTRGGFDVVFIGDSITQGWESNGKTPWKKTFAPLKAGNFGIGGDQTGHVLWRLTKGDELSGTTPKVAVVMIGTNNIGSHTPKQIAEGAEAIVKELQKQKKGIKVLLLGIFPRKTDKKGHSDWKKAQEVNTIIAKLGDGKNVVYRDLAKKLSDKSGNPDPKLYLMDLVHLRPRGYAAWAEAIEADVKKLLGE